MAQATPKIIRGLLQPDKNSTNLILTTFPTPGKLFLINIILYVEAPASEAGDILEVQEHSPLAYPSDLFTYHTGTIF